jgi:hypothetical protein
MPVQYVKDFHFPPSPPRPTVAGYARGGHVKASTPQPYAKGGSAGCYSKGGSPDIKVAATRAEKSSGVQKPAFAKGGNLGGGHKSAFLKKKDGGSIKTAAGAVKMGEKSSWNKDDAVSPGSFKRTPPGEKETNASAARSKFDGEGRNTDPATKQDGNVERMSGWSDFKNGGRIKNLGKYAHGGKVKSTKSEAPSGKAGSGAVNKSAGVDAGKYESSAGTPKKAAGSRVEMKSGTAKAAMGGLSRGTSPKKNAAIHAKMAHKSVGPKAGGLGALAGALSGMGMPHQGPQAPPGMAPGMGAPPGGQMGAIAPQAPQMGGGPPAMAHGGGVKHVIVHHISHR